MKSLSILFFLFTIQLAIGQNGNSTCSNPYIYCHENMDQPAQPFGPDQGNICVNGYTKLYFNFIYMWNSSYPYGNNGFGYGLNSSLSSTTNIPSTYKIYGPFDTNIGACELINTYQAPIAIQGSTTSSSGFHSTAVLEYGKYYFMEITVNACDGFIGLMGDPDESVLECPGFESLGCVNCIPKFQPDFGEYVISAWAKESTGLNSTVNKLNYDQAQIDILAGGAAQPFNTSGKVIDGWQKIEGIFQVTDNTTFELQLKSLGANKVLYDDIRIYPNDGSAITYVYDPLTHRLMAELDERNYATLYEYDEEGKLVRIKKETEKGIMTIQENRENNSLKP